MPEPEQMRVADVARLFGMSRTSVARWARRGWPAELEWRRRGQRLWVTDRADLVRAWVAGDWEPAPPPGQSPRVEK